uniref:Uncharacterized protein n=1 Tax=Chaetoceros debilis TaxID=122233 RepID=A0A7S3V486_9STRA|mmetsp:Transcript_16444/g.24680  ORF Transcript_16444/g.24680 Transcript_16444/m.24680 type:complete len:731 (+) Transcript_16444:92-2284(+)
MESSRSVCSRRSLSSRRSTRSLRSRSTRRAGNGNNNNSNTSGVLLNGLDELDLRVAALVREKDERTRMINDTFSAAGETSFIDEDDRESLHLEHDRDKEAFLIANIVQMNQQSNRAFASNFNEHDGVHGHDHGYGHNHRGRSARSASRSGRSTSRSGRSVRSTRSVKSKEVREAEIARTVLRQSMSIDDDNVSVVSTYTTDHILAELTDNEDCKSVRSSRSQRSRRSRSSTGHRRASSLLPSPGDISVHTTRRSRSASKSASKSVTTRKVRLKDTDGGIADETQRLYNSFMKNLSREEMQAHDTKVLSNASNVRAEISAGALAQNRNRNANARVNASESMWSLAPFENNLGFAVNQTQPSAPTRSQSSKPALSSSGSNMAMTKSSSRISKTSLTRGFSAPESNSTSYRSGKFDLQPFDPQNTFNSRSEDSVDPLSSRISSSGRRNADTSKSSLISKANASVSTNRRRDERKENGGKLAREKSSTSSTRAGARFTFLDKTNLGRTARSSKIDEGYLASSPVRDSIAIIPRCSPLPTTSKNSYVPQMSGFTSKDKSWKAFGENSFKSEGIHDDFFPDATFPNPFSDHKKQSSDNNSKKVSLNVLNGNDHRREDTVTKHSSNKNKGSYADPFDSSPPAGSDEGSGFGAFEWQGFETSSAFEATSSVGWETATDSPRPRSSPKNTSMTSAWSDTSPAGILDFHSGNIGSEKIGSSKDLPQTDLFSARDETSQWS